MVSWQLLSDNTSAEVWDKRLMQFPDYNIYQVYAWGQHRANFGWKPLRLMALDQEGNLAAMIQVMLRRYPGNIVLLWSPGGPVGNLEACNDSLPQALIRETRSKRIYCRISSLRAYQTCDALTLKACSWTKCSQPLNSGLSMSLQLHTEEQFLNGVTKNWRHNLKRSQKQKQSISLWEKPDINLMLQVYHSMQEYKGLEVLHTKNGLQSMFQLCNKNIIIYKCQESNGEITGFRACAVFGDKAWDLLAATTVVGRKTYASYGIFTALITHCIKIGVKHYDLTGIDPLANKGVYDFKKGTGAQFLEYLGEWDWSTSGLLRWAANRAIKKKGGGL